LTDEHEDMMSTSRGNPSARNPATSLPLASARFADKDRPPRPTNAALGWGSDVVAEMLRRLDVRYISLLPGASYRGLHDSLVNYLGNEAPKMLLCLHEEHAVALAQGYAKITERPMAVALHSNIGLMHATMAIFNLFIGRTPALVLGATGPGDADQRRPWIDWIHTSKDQGALIRNYSKWDDEPRSPAAAIESMLRAYQIAATPPYGPTYVCLDVAMQEAPLEAEITFPDVARFAPGEPPAPSAAATEEAARLLAGARKPVILMGRVSRREDDWTARVALAESLGAAVLTDLKQAAAFPTDHRLHIVEPRFRPSPAFADILRAADVILALDWVDLKGTFELALGKGAPVEARVINCTLDRFVHNGWSMDYQGLPPADLPILAPPDTLVRPLTEAIHRRRGTAEPAAPKFDKPAAPALPEPRAVGPMGLKDLALVVAGFVRERDVTTAGYALGWPADTVCFRHPLDWIGTDGGGGVGSGPGIAVGAALALKDSGRIPLAILGDGDFMMSSSALWTAAHMGIPLIVVVANNRSYYNDVAHQERMATQRSRPVENKLVGQEINDPAIDLVAIARAQGWAAEGPVETSGDLRAALNRAEAAVRAGKPYFIEALVDPNVGGGRGHTGGRGQ
jgi:thiamine pyrophosphate-dependent acetolactate synthase large subunit-like protein